jgi:putative FmdB family regulatory protein
MAIYDYYCASCGTTFEEFGDSSDSDDFDCPRCGTWAAQVPVAPGVHLFGEQTFEHIAPDPITVSSRRELREVCEKHECYHPGYMDGFSERG